MRRKIQQAGKIDKSGKLKMFMGELNQFFSMNRNKTIIATFEVYDTPSESLKGYYMNYVIPTMQKAFYENGERYSLTDTEKVLREMSPVDLSEDYTTDQLTEQIEWLKEFAAENFNVYIEEPCML